MSDTVDDMSTIDRHYVTLILRLTLNRTGQLLLGELVDATDTLHKRFLGLAGLNQAVETWLRQQELPTTDDSSTDQDNGNERGDP